MARWSQDTVKDLLNSPTRGSNILVTPERLHAVSGQLSAGAATIESTLSQLQGEVVPLQSEWRGQAQAQFEALWQERHRSVAGIQHALHVSSQLTASVGSPQ